MKIDFGGIKFYFLLYDYDLKIIFYVWLHKKFPQTDLHYTTFY